MPRRVAATALLVVLAVAPALGWFCEARCAEPASAHQHRAGAPHAHHPDAAAHGPLQATAAGSESPVVTPGSATTCRSHLETDLAAPERTAAVAVEAASETFSLAEPVASLRRLGAMSKQRPPPHSQGATPLRV